jgi:hypothetical protein
MVENGHSLTIARSMGWRVAILILGIGAFIAVYSQVDGRGQPADTKATTPPIEVPPALAAGDETISYR